MGIEGHYTPKTVENQPKNKFLELWQYKGRRLESARATNRAKAVTIAEGYEYALQALHDALAQEYLQGPGGYYSPSDRMEDIHRDDIDSYINSLSVDQIQKHIDLLKAHAEGIASDSVRELGGSKKEDAKFSYAFIDGLDEISNRLV